MENEENGVVKERPAQTDVRYRPGTFGFTTSKNVTDSEHEDEKSPYEKMLEDETEKENRRRQALGLGFVLGTPNDESDGTILFNYDEPPAPANEEQYKNQSFVLDSDSTLNNALRRAIREQQDQELNKRFMEGGSSGSSLETVGSAVEIDERDSDGESSLIPQQQNPPSTVESKPEEKQTNIHHYDQQQENKQENSVHHPQLLQQTNSKQEQKEATNSQQLQQQTSPQTVDQKEPVIQIQTQKHQTQEQQKERHKTQERLDRLQSENVLKQELVATRNSEMEQEDVRQESSLLDDGADILSSPTASAKAKKQSFFRRFFGKK